MKDIKYIKPTNMLNNVSILPWLFWWMFTDYYNLPSWVVGVVYTLFAIGTIATITKFLVGESVDLLEKK